MKISPVNVSKELKAVKDEMIEWRDHKELVLHELQRMNSNIEKLFDGYIETQKELSSIKTRSAILGTMAGFSVSLLMVIIDWVRK